MTFASVGTIMGFLDTLRVGEAFGVLLKVKDIWTQVLILLVLLCSRYNISFCIKDMIFNDKNLFKLNIVNGTVQFSNVTFNYPSRPDVRVLSGIDFKVSDGQKVSLVGSSGCGKSTIVKLLLKLYDCDDGQVSNSVNNYYYICA